MGIKYAVRVVSTLTNHDIKPNARPRHEKVLYAIIGDRDSFYERVHDVVHLDTLNKLGEKYLADAVQCLALAHYDSASEMLDAITSVTAARLAEVRAARELLVPCAIGLMNAADISSAKLELGLVCDRRLPVLLGSLFGKFVNSTWATDGDSVSPYLRGEFSRSLSEHLGGSHAPTKEMIEYVEKLIRSMNATMQDEVNVGSHWVINEVSHRLMTMLSMSDRVRMLATHYTIVINRTAA
jgi:hypothetical protein